MKADLRSASSPISMLDRLPLPRWALVTLACLATALLLRGPTFGNPVLHVDEQFYLLVGDRMWQGALPYVDIWDRKPIGLFLIYAGIRLLGGSGIIQYQIIAMLAATATALVIYRIARAIAPPAGALWAGIAYLLCLSGYNCFGGQAPVFYNLLVALAAAVLCQTLTIRQSSQLLGSGLLAMALIGCAIQIKYTVVFEGGAFGLALIARARHAGWSHTRLVAAAAAWASMALLPTALALAFYTSVGHGPAFVFANFMSIFGRQDVFSEALFRLAKEMLALIPIWLALFLAPRHLLPVTGRNPGALPLLRAWALVAVLGFLAFGTWYDHYVAPLLVPLCVLAAPALGRPRGAGRWYTLLLIGFGALVSTGVIASNMAEHGTKAEITRATALIRTQLTANPANPCLYIYEGDPILYLTTHSCTVTPYIFSAHLCAMVDVKALGIDVAAEVTRIMASRPAVVMLPSIPMSMPANVQTQAIVTQVLAKDYEHYATTRIGAHDFEFYRVKPKG